MKVIKPLTMLVAIFLFNSPAYASDPCASLLCLAGKLNGSSSSDCKQPIADYFSILSFGRHHSFSPGATQNNRNGFINGCSGSTQTPGNLDNIKSSVSNAYGTLRYEP